MVQVIKNWFTGIPNPTRSSGYDEVDWYLSDECGGIHRVFNPSFLGDVKFEAARSRSNFVGRSGSFLH